MNRGAAPNPFKFFNILDNWGTFAHYSQTIACWPYLDVFGNEPQAPNSANNLKMSFPIPQNSPAIPTPQKIEHG